MKKILGTLMLAAGVLGTAALPLTAAAGEVSLNGEGTVNYTPDSARLQFTASAEHERPEKASEQVAEAMKQWRRAIRPYRDELKDYSDANLTLYTRRLPVRDNNEKPETRAVASQTVSFTIADLELLNPLIDQAQKIGLQYHLGPQQFFHSDETELEKQALARAIQDARERCQFVANQLEQRCGEVVSLSVDGGHRPVTMMRAEASSGGDAISSIGPREINASVSATFKLD
ncbi:SIMPL domain-containing protein [Marinobacter nauticus]